jgi:hypothetical protein
LSRGQDVGINFCSDKLIRLLGEELGEEGVFGAKARAVNDGACADAEKLGDSLEVWGSEGGLGLGVG